MEINTSRTKQRTIEPEEGPRPSKSRDERHYDCPDDPIARYDITIIQGKKKTPGDSVPDSGSGRSEL
jgi:hypothetical protein